MNEIIFFNSALNADSKELTLDQEESRHLVKVLRMREGENAFVVNGRGLIAEVDVRKINKGSAILQIKKCKQEKKKHPLLHIAVAHLRHKDRLEWMIEKLTELGVHQITLLTTSRSLQHRVDEARCQKIMISALKQSKNLFLPLLSIYNDFDDFLMEQSSHEKLKLIASCENVDQNYILSSLNKERDTLLLIGPEGDFTPLEIQKATGKGFAPVSFGNQRLRTETAAIFASSVISAFYED